MKNLYYLSCSPIPSQKANSIQVMKMCQAFSKHCNKVVLYCIKSKSKTDLHKYYGVSKSFSIEMIKRPNIKFLNRIIYAIIVFYKLKKQKAEGILYSRDIFSTGTICLLKPKNLSIIFEAHAPPATPLRKFFLKIVFKNPNFTGLVTISEALKNEYLRLYGDLIRDAVTVAHDGADSDQIPSEMLQQKEYSNKGEKLRLGYIGSLYKGKGAEMIIKLAGLMPEHEFHIVGGSDEQIAEIKSKFQLENMIFHGFVSPDQIYYHMDKFDIMLAPYQGSVIVGGGTLDISKWMSPLKLFEYMGGGKPIISSDLPVLREVITNNSIALLSNPDDPNDWVKNVELLNQNPTLRMELGTTAQKEYFEKYTWDQRSIHVIKTIIKDSKPE